MSGVFSVPVLACAVPEYGVRTSLMLDESGVKIFCAGFSSSSYCSIFATSFSKTCSIRPSLSPTLLPLEGSLSSGYSWLRHVVPRVKQPAQTGTSSVESWHLTFRRLPVHSQYRYSTPERTQDNRTFPTTFGTLSYPFARGFTINTSRSTHDGIVSLIRRVSSRIHRS